MPENLDPAAASPLLCGGITTYSPLKHWNVGPGKKVGIVGIGGLGHLAIKLAKAMGAHVVVFTTSPSKLEDAKNLGADEAVLSTDQKQVNAHARSLHFILDTVSAAHDANAYLNLLKADGALVLVGAPMEPLPVSSFSLIVGRRSFAGSNIGGIEETQEMLEFCARHNITADIEMISIQQINDAYERLLKADVRYRFVVDMASLKE
jgi:alcohol dehydrogenase (NADP+)